MSGWWEQKIKSVRQKIIGRYYWVGLMHELVYDLFNTGNLSWSQKIWAYRHGFFAYRITEYGLNDDNYHLYLPDSVYYRLHPINGRFHFWIDDKLTMKYVLYPFDIYLPRYYYYLGNGGQVTRLMDCPTEYSESVDGVLSLLRQESRLAAKLISGSRGQGFYSLAYQEGQYLLNNEPINIAELKAFLARKQRYLLTEWLFSNPELSRIWSGAASSVRIVAYRNANQTRIAGAYVKFGTSSTGPVDNIAVGGISAKVDLDSGTFSDPRIFRDNQMQAIMVHPDSGEVINGTLPFWEEIKSTLYAIGDYLPNLIYMGYDIIISENSFKIIEINSLPAIDILNCYRPLLSDPDVSEFFNRLRESL